MKFKLINSKVIHKGNFDDLISREFAIGGIQMGGNISTRKQNILPIKLDLKYRVYENNIHLDSYMVDYWYIIQFDYEENPYHELINLIQLVLKDFIHKFFTEAFDTDLLPEILSAYIDNDTSRENQKSKANEIIKNAQIQFLLKDKLD